MDRRSELLRIFGLSAVAGKNDIRRAYRRMAMQFHPDKNPDPKAHQRFIQLTAAYEQLLADRFDEPKPVAASRRPATEQRMKQAQKRYVYQQAHRMREQHSYFLQLTSGRRWRIFRMQVAVSTFVALILLVEPWIQTHFHTDEIVAYSSIYNGLQEDLVRCVSTKSDLRIFIESVSMRSFLDEPRVWIEKSWFTHQPVRIWHQTLHHTNAIPVDFSFSNMYPAMSGFFFIPLFTYWYRRKNYYFTFLYLFSQYFVGIVLLYLLLTQDRWAHLVTFGFI